MPYFPDGRDIVCINGNNKYTRALYGTHTLFRLETSDRPIFATYDKGKSKNIRLWLSYNGFTTRLDSTTFCEARYQGGRREYILRDKAWKKGEIHIMVMASYSDEGAVWKFSTKNFDDDVILSASLNKIRGKKFYRNGDLGMDDMSKFEPLESEKPLQTISWKGNKETFLILRNNERLITPSSKEGERIYNETESSRQMIANAVEFNTPDPFINTLGSNLCAAADGLWDGETNTWLHGCIGWRMPLCGWRAAYVADAIGWNDRAVKHFDAYANSQVTDVPPIYPHPTQDRSKNLARAEKKWGTQMYSNGYICRYPNRKDNMHHYDMNLNYIDELLWHFCYDADTAYMRKLWPIITAHLDWEKRNFDADGDYLYDGYCCIWASDALYYNSGGVTHSTAYNYRANKLASRIAEIIGEDGRKYKAEADSILHAMNTVLWLEPEGHWAEFIDFIGLKRVHKSAAIWSIYTPIDCGACTPQQAWRATEYVDRSLPHIPILIKDSMYNTDNLSTLATTNWLPYEWSTNNVAHEEVMNMVLAYFKAGRSDVGYRLLKADILDGMYMGQSPGNFGQISYYDKACSEAYRDFGDNIGISSRALINGLFGIQPDALYGRCIIKPAFPLEWDSVSIKTPYLSYSYKRVGNKARYEIEQHFKAPLNIVVSTCGEDGEWVEKNGSNDEWQVIEIDMPERNIMKNHDVDPNSSNPSSSQKDFNLDKLGLSDISVKGQLEYVDLSRVYNSNVDDIFKNEYLTPRSPYTTLEMPIHGIGEWCVPDRKVEIEDSGFRSKLVDGMFDTNLGVSFKNNAEGKNVVYTSLWDNYPDSVVIPLKGKASKAYLLLAGSTNNMQSRIDNGIIVATYNDDSTDTLHLENPLNWCPIEQDYYIDGLAFETAPLRPYRVHLGTGIVTRELSKYTDIFTKDTNLSNAKQNIIQDGAAEILTMSLNNRKKLKSLTIRTLSNDVIVGLMSLTLER